MKRLAFVAVLLVLVALPAWAYVDGTPTLGQLLRDATQVAVLQVEKVSQEKRVILYRKIADLKGRLDQEQIKHRITDGLHSREPKTILDWAQPGKVAICFIRGNVAQICLGRYWYECAAQQPPWWSMTRGRPELVLAYCGPIANLRRHIPVMVAGKEATITAVVHGVTGWRGVRSGRLSPVAGGQGSSGGPDPGQSQNAGDRERADERPEFPGKS